MFKLSSKADYGIRALVDLAQHDGRGPIPSAEISARQRIPESLVGQILGLLGAAGFVRSVRGAQGGHELARAADAIRLDDVVLSLEGSICPDDDRARPPHCGQRAIWDEVRAAILDVLGARTIADLAAEGSAAADRRRDTRPPVGMPRGREGAVAWR